MQGRGPMGRPPKRDNGKEADEQTTLAFAVSTLQDLKANEKVVLRWKWEHCTSASGAFTCVTCVSASFLHWFALLSFL